MTPRPHILARTVGLTMAYAVSVLFSLALTRGPEGVATIWLASGILASAFLMLPWRASLVMASLCFAYNLVANLVVGNPPWAAFLFPVLTFSEALGASWLARKVCGATMRLTSLKRVARLILLAIAPATAAVSIVAADVFTIFGRDFNQVLTSWFYGHALGMAIMLPAALLIARPDMIRDFRRPPLEQLALYALIAAASASAFLPIRFPLALCLFPVLAVVAFRLGPRGAAVGALVTAVVLSTMVVSTPLNPHSAYTAVERVRSMQFLMTMGFLTSLAMAMAIADQKRLKRLWAGRSRVARAAQARAVAAGLAKTEFLATMSHEIRTPMSSIVGFTEVLLKRDDLPEPARRQLALIDRAGASLLTVVNDILDFSKMEAGEVDLAPAPAAPRTVAQDALAIVAEAARRKGLDVQLGFIGPVETPVLIDDLRVRQILLNLLSNAIKFTDKGRVRLDVQSVDEGGEALLLRFKVTDTGAGVASDQVERLFRRFSQGDSSVSRTHGGTGLGLAICKGLTELMGGRIGVDSKPGEGSTFWFEIPAARAQSPAPAAAPVEGGALAARILLVDDHPMNRELGATVLGLLGCEVILAENGEEGVAAAETSGCDLILMDVHMPRMDGLEAARAIRALDGPCSQVPIIAMSADVMPEMEAACLKAGMNASVGKPIQIQALHAVLTKWLSADREAAAA